MTAATAAHKKISAPAPKKKQKVRMTQDDLDRKVYGPEPDMTGVNDVNRTMRLAKALSWYALTYDKKKHSRFVADWLKKQDYFKITNEEIKNLNMTYFASTFYGLMRMETRGGLILSDDDISKIKNHVMALIDVPSKEDEPTTKNDDADTPKKQKRNPQELLRIKLNESILAELEGFIDIWLFSPSLKERKEAVVDLQQMVSTHEIKGTVAFNTIKEFTQSKLDEFESVLKATSGSDLAEAYDTLKAPNLKRAIANLKQLLKDIELTKVNVKNIQQKQRAPRMKKAVPAHKAVENLKYKQSDTTFKITSIDPITIIDKKTLFVFDTKYKCIRLLQSEVGFTVKGTTVQGVDEALSFQKNVRKPEDVLPVLLSKTKLQSEKMIKELTSKEQKTSGRMNENCILLRVF